MTELIDAVREGNIDLVKSLSEDKNFDINKKHKWGYTALHLATFSKQEGIVELLLENKPDLYLKERLWGRTALQLAIEYGHEEIADLLKKEMLK
jgi:ankyrin repeat protein